MAFSDKFREESFVVHVIFLYKAVSIQSHSKYLPLRLWILQKSKMGHPLRQFHPLRLLIFANESPVTVIPSVTSI